MATRYFARERFFTGLSPSLVHSTVVFASDDLTADECRTLAQSVQKAFDDLKDMRLADSWYFELAPSAEEDPAAFINMKSEWDQRNEEIEGYGKASGNSWQFDVHWLYSVACEHANIIRQLRSAEMPVVYLQCDSGRGFETFDCVSCLTWDEIETLESLLDPALNELGLILKIVSDLHAEREPATFIQAKLGWKRFEESVKKQTADEDLYSLSGISYEYIEEIKGLRSKPVVYGREDDDDSRDQDRQPSLAVDGQCAAVEPTRADEGLRSGYRDPDNYWRNVWLYEQRSEGKTNAAILRALADRAEEFNPLESENSLRAAIDSIAQFHGWKMIRGRPGRPKAAHRRSVQTTTHD